MRAKMYKNMTHSDSVTHFPTHWIEGYLYYQRVMIDQLCLLLLSGSESNKFMQVQEISRLYDLEFSPSLRKFLEIFFCM